jgi:MYXO-CTERM domain-containing protein
MCVPPYVPPCTEDADCGPGFRCVEEIARGCSGSSGTGTGGSSGGDTPAPPPPPPECFEEPTGNFICELQELPCETDDDCEAGLTCEANPNRPVCSSAGSDDGQEGAAPDRAAACPTIDVPTHLCLPPSYASGWGRDLGGVAEDGSGTPTSGSGNGAPRTDDETSNNDSTGDPNGAPGESDDDGPQVGGGDGCSTTAAGSGNWLSLAGLMLLLGTRRRRRS